MDSISVVLEKALSKRIKSRNVYVKPKSERRGTNGYKSIPNDIELFIQDYLNSIPLDPTADDFGFDPFGTQMPSSVTNVSLALKNLAGRLQ